jgi:hypothetical protein
MISGKHRKDGGEFMIHVDPVHEILLLVGDGQDEVSEELAG